MNQNVSLHSIASYIADHRLSLGLFLAAYGAFYLSAVILGGWTFFDWGKDIFNVAPFATQALIPRSAISPIFFVTSLPALLVGVILLCDVTIRGLRPLTAKSQYAAFVLTVFGFAYVVVGAWPLQNKVDFAWEWQKQIMNYGLPFTWMLYLVSLFVFVVGVISLYVHSKAYRQRYPEPVYG
ncbi:MAG: hypothetical protein LBQ98_10070 [Nitrososphaerota archaeon]|jgi:hypothetical protein|nr:hypothetical protein [Nitrososphaerota archaeon]